MDFPRMVHKPDARLVVSSQEQFDAALADGWCASRSDFGKIVEVEPVPDETPTVDVPVDAPKRRGRPRKG